jgi:CDP-2,3-bis-(O-geranylgeranyl)-sn-glycerol synthase
MVFTIYNLVEAVWLILPAYAANGLTPLVGLRKNLHPIDGGRTLGKSRLIGEGKSWEGLIFGVAVAILISTVEMLAYPYLPWGLSDKPLMIVPMSPLLGLALGMGAMLGDAAGSFVKRRLGRPRGSPVPLMDQLDFLLGAFLLAALIVPVRLEWVLLMVLITPVFHLLANVIGFRLGVKKTPW